MNNLDGVFGLFAKQYDTQKEAEMSLEDYLKACAREPMAYATAAERMLAAIARAFGWSFGTHRTDRPPHLALLALYGALSPDRRR